MCRMSEIELKRRYPESRPEDITDAYTRGVETGLTIANANNYKLRELCADLRFCRRNNCLKCSHGRFCDMRFDERCAELRIEAGE